MSTWMWFFEIKNVLLWSKLKVNCLVSSYNLIIMHSDIWCTTKCCLPLPFDVDHCFRLTRTIHFSSLIEIESMLRLSWYSMLISLKVVINSYLKKLQIVISTEEWNFCLVLLLSCESYTWIANFTLKKVFILFSSFHTYIAFFKFWNWNQFLKFFREFLSVLEFLAAYLMFFQNIWTRRSIQALEVWPWRNVSEAKN